MTHTGCQTIVSIQNERHGKKKNVFHDRVLEPFSMNTGRRPLMEKFKPALPERLLPKDPHPNYLPMFMEPAAKSPETYSCRDCNKRKENKLSVAGHRTIRHPQTLRPQSLRPQTDSNTFHNPTGDSASLKHGAKCPHCLKGLAYAYNLSKHIEVCIMLNIDNTIFEII